MSAHIGASVMRVVCFILVFERFTSTRTRLSSIRTFSSGLYGVNTGYEKISIIRVLYDYL